MLLFSCNNAPRPVTNANSSLPASNDRTQSVLAHSGENQPTRPMGENSSGGKRPQTGDPIDTKVYDGAISAAEKNVKAKPADEGAKKAAAQAYFERGVALTEARQYATALGDYRRALKYDPDHEESKKWIDQIVGIYSMLKKDPPKEGEEPPPLPLQKTTP